MTKTTTLLYVIRCDVFWFQDELNIWNPAYDRTFVRERNKATYPFSFPSSIALWKTGRENCVDISEGTKDSKDNGSKDFGKLV